MSLHFGILLLDPHGGGVQWQDISPVDLLGNISPEYLASLGPPPGAPTDASPGAAGSLLGPVPKGTPIQFHYISDTIDKPANLTSGVRIVPTDTYESCPKLDYLWIPGPPPSYVPTVAELAFIKKSWGEVKTLFSICTGSIALGASGVADGMSATGNREIIGLLKMRFPEVKWDGTKRWVVDGGDKLWTCGGALTGIDMLATFMREHFDPAAVALALRVGDTTIRSQTYDE